jgi:transaldolase
MFVYNQDKIFTKAIHANVRHPPHYLPAAKSRAQLSMTLYIVFLQMVNHPLIDIGIEPVSLRLERVFNDK